jgi:hypothetical protein
MAGAKIALTSNAGELQQDENGNAKVNLPTDSSQAGTVAFFSENDDGTFRNGTRYIKSPETSVDWRLRVGIDTVLMTASFNAAAQDTANWAYTFNTLTAAQPGAGTVNFSTVQGTTSAHGAFMRTRQYFPLIGTAPLAVEVTAGQFTAALVANEVFLFGLGLPGAATTEPTDGVFLRLTTAGLVGEIRYNNITTQTGILRTLAQLSIGLLYKWVIIIGEREVEFWQDDNLLAELEMPAGNGQPFLSTSLPAFLMKYNTGAVSNTNTMRVSDITVSLMDLQTAKPWSHQMAGMGMNAAQGQTGGTMGTTALLPNATAATTLTGGAISQTVPIATGLGGQAGIVANVAGADGLITAFLVPVGGINQTARNLYITGVRIDAVNVGAAVATTASILQWSLAFGATGGTVPSLAQAESASFATATAKAYRRIALGLQSWVVGAAIGASAEAIMINFDTPIVVAPGEWVATVAKFLVGTATASQVIWTTSTINAYYE